MPCASTASAPPGSNANASSREQRERLAREQREQARKLAAYRQAVHARKDSIDRELELLRGELDATRARREQIHREFHALNERAKEVGQLAKTVEATFPTGYGATPAPQQLDGYRQAIEQLGSATRRRQRKRLAQEAAIVRSWLPSATRQLLDRANRDGISDAEMLERYQQSRIPRDELYRQAGILYVQAHGGQQFAHGYLPGMILLDHAGMTPINQLEEAIAAAEAKLRALDDPQQTIAQRLARALEINPTYGRAPADLREANSWSQHWKHGIMLEQQDGQIFARIPELPEWRHPLTRQQHTHLQTITNQGQQKGRILLNLGIHPLVEETRRLKRIRDRGNDRGYGMEI